MASKDTRGMSDHVAVLHYYNKGRQIILKFFWELLHN